MARALKFLSKEDLLRAHKNTLSNKAAARYLRVSYVHYKKYALTYIDEETGLSLLVAVCLFETSGQTRGDVCA